MTFRSQHTKYGPPFCVFNVTRNIKNFVQISILLNKTKIVEISGNIESTKRHTTFSKELFRRKKC